jgi:nitrogen fixation protein
VPKPRSTYVLTDTGKKKLEALLEKVFEVKSEVKFRTWKGGKIWNRTTVRSWCGVSEDTLQKVLTAVDPGAAHWDRGENIEEKKMVDLFGGLYRESGLPLDGKVGDAITNKVIKENLVGREGKEILRNCWQLYTPEPSSKCPVKLAGMLRSLDARDQQKAFQDALEPGANQAFLLSAPCSDSQQWLLDCLTWDPEYFKEAHRVQLCVNSHQIRQGDFNVLWVELRKKLRQKTKADTIKALSDCDRPVLISLYHFGDKSCITPADVMEKFWLPLLEELPDYASRRLTGGRIVLLLADWNVERYEMPKDLHLPALKEISQKDVKSWFSGNSVREWGHLELDDPQWVANFLKKGFSKEWTWQEPGKVLDQICFTLGLTNGVEDVLKKWEWS